MSLVIGTFVLDFSIDTTIIGLVSKRIRENVKGGKC